MLVNFCSSVRTGKKLWAVEQEVIGEMLGAPISLVHQELLGTVWFQS